MTAILNPSPAMHRKSRLARAVKGLPVATFAVRGLAEPGLAEPASRSVTITLIHPMAV